MTGNFNFRRSIFLSGTFVLCAFLTLGSSGYATIIEVYSGSSIQTAINSAVSGDTIKAYAGTYTENLAITGKELIVISDNYDAVNTIIDGNGADRVISLEQFSGKIQGFTIRNGSQTAGGGIRVYQSAINSNDSVVISDNILTDNVGRGIYSVTSKALIRNNIFMNNSTTARGGGIMCYNYDSSTVIGNIFRDNVAGNNGGAIACVNNTNNVVENNTLVHNDADYGGGIHIGANVSVAFSKNIVVQNFGGGINYVTGGILTLSCNDVWDNEFNDYLNCSAAPDDISADPEFCDTASNNFGLWDTSPCAAANNDCGVLIGAKDVDPTCTQQSGIIHVPGDYATIQEAIDNSLDGDTILVDNGLYEENLTINNRELFIISQYEYGGDDNAIANTVIDGGRLDPVIGLEYSSGKIQGFTITNGDHMYAGGIGFYQSAINSDDSLVICDNIIRDNYNSGILSWTSKALIRNNLILRNHSYDYGGGVSCYGQDSSTVIGNIFRDNDAVISGGAIMCWQNNYNVIENNTVIHNTSVSGGGVCVTNSASADIIRNIIVQNSGGGFYINSDGIINLSCNNVWDNRDGDDYYGCSPAPDDIAADPLFCDTTVNDFGLYDISPCAPTHPLNICGDLMGAHDVGCEYVPVKITVPTDYLTIQEAIDNALFGDTILVENGTYDENLTVYGTKLILISQYALTGDNNDIVNTVIDGGNNNRVLLLDKALGKVQGFTITNGSSSYAGGMELYQSGKYANDVIICDNIIRDNVGSGIYSDGSVADITNNQFMRNKYGDYGGGIASLNYGNWLIITENIFRDNEAAVAGGAIYYGNNTTNSIWNNTLVHNTAPLGGGIYISTSSRPGLIEISMNIIVQNFGGGIDNSESGVHFLLQCNDIWENEGYDCLNCPISDDISEDPLFCDTVNNDFGLLYGSPCSPEFNTCGEVLIGARDVNCVETDLPLTYVPDLAVGYENGNGLSSFTGNGEGGFGAENYYYGKVCQDITAADFNGDGILDIAATDDLYAAVNVYEGKGTGEFELLSPNPITIDFPHSIVSGDFDNDADGYIDLAVGCHSTNQVHIYSGNGSFGFSPIGTPTSVGLYPTDMHTGDFDGDGDLDLVVVNNLSNTISLLGNNGSGEFTVYSTPSVGNNPKEVEVGYFDSDLHLDLAVTNSGDGNVTIFINDGGGNFDDLPVVEVGADPRGIEPGYFNFDNFIDLAVTNHADNTVSILINDGSGNFEERKTCPLGSAASPQDVAVGHLNDDGKHDLVVSHMGDVGASAIDVLLNDGYNDFPTVSEIPCAYAARAILLDDFDLDMYGGLNRVVNENDDGPGSFRAAIEAANENPGRDTISFELGSGVHNIDLTSDPLPAIEDDYTIINGNHEIIFIDGSGLSIGSGLEISSSFNKIVNFYELLLYNFQEDGIKILGGSYNIIESCTYTKDNMGDGIKIVDGIGNTILSYCAQSSNAGAGFRVYGGNGNTISQSLTLDNGGLGIDLGDVGVTLNDYPDDDGILNYPEIEKILLVTENFDVLGTAAPNATVEFYAAFYYVTEFEANDFIDPDGHGEGLYIGSTVCAGTGEFLFTVPEDYEEYSILTATATDVIGTTSEFCENFSLTPDPFVIWGESIEGPVESKADCPSVIDMLVIDPNGKRCGYDTSGTFYEEIPGAEYHETLDCNDSVYIMVPILGSYMIKVVSDRNYTPQPEDNPMYTLSVQLADSPPDTLVELANMPEEGVDSSAYSVEMPQLYTCGDANGDEIVNVADAVYLINHVFKSGPAPDPLEAGDANCDGIVNVADAVYLINYVFKSGPEPCCP